MSLLDTIKDQVSGAIPPGAAGGDSSGLTEIVAGLINNPQTGGLQGLISAFHEKGLGGVMASWIGTGENLPISAQQLQSVLGNEQVRAIAQKLGISGDAAASGLASVLPQVIDKLTPTGTVPESGALGQAIDLLKGLRS